MAQHWNIDPATGDYVLVGGQPQQLTNLKIPAYYRWKTKRTKWMYAPNNKFGSDFYTLKKNISSDNDVSQIENLAARALQPLVDDGRATEITVEMKKRERHGFCLAGRITEASGEIQEFEFDAIGVR